MVVEWRGLQILLLVCLMGFRSMPSVEHMGGNVSCIPC